MKSHTNPNFRKMFAALPADVREQARAAYRLFRSNPRHPGLTYLTCYRFSAMRPRDTSAKAAAIQDRLHDAMGPEGRFRLAMRMSELAREFAKAGVRDRHPQLADDEVLIELAKIFYDKRRRP